MMEDATIVQFIPNIIFCTILAEVSYKFGFVRLFIWPQGKISGSLVFFLILFHEVRHRKVRKVTDPGFGKKSGEFGVLKKS